MCKQTTVGKQTVNFLFGDFSKRMTIWSFHKMEPCSSVGFTSKAIGTAVCIFMNKYGYENIQIGLTGRVP